MKRVFLFMFLPFVLVACADGLTPPIGLSLDNRLTLQDILLKLNTPQVQELYDLTLPSGNGYQVGSFDRKSLKSQLCSALNLSVDSCSLNSVVQVASPYQAISFHKGTAADGSTLATDFNWSKETDIILRDPETGNSVVFTLANPQIFQDQPLTDIVLGNQKPFAKAPIPPEFSTNVVHAIYQTGDWQAFIKMLDVPSDKPIEVRLKTVVGSMPYNQDLRVYLTAALQASLTYNGVTVPQALSGTAETADPVDVQMRKALEPLKAFYDGDQRTLMVRGDSNYVKLQNFYQSCRVVKNLSLKAIRLYKKDPTAKGIDFTLIQSGGAVVLAKYDDQSSVGYVILQKDESQSDSTQAVFLPPPQPVSIQTFLPPDLAQSATTSQSLNDLWALAADNKLAEMDVFFKFKANPTSSDGSLKIAPVDTTIDAEFLVDTQLQFKQRSDLDCSTQSGP